jgi:hypothetical protein
METVAVQELRKPPSFGELLERTAVVAVRLSFLGAVVVVEIDVAEGLLSYGGL